MKGILTNISSCIPHSRNETGKRPLGISVDQWQTRKQGSDSQEASLYLPPSISPSDPTVPVETRDYVHLLHIRPPIPPPTPPEQNVVAATPGAGWGGEGVGCLAPHPVHTPPILLTKEVILQSWILGPSQKAALRGECAERAQGPT